MKPLHLLAITFIAAGIAKPDEEVPPPAPAPPPVAAHKPSVRPPAVPAPAWLTSRKPELEGEEERVDRARFEVFNIDSIPPDEVELWRQRWKEKCNPEYSCDDQLAMLLRLRDEETARYLLSQLAQGRRASYDDAEILGASGQEWLIPRMEREIFLKPEDEPIDENPGDVRGGGVSEAARGGFLKIIRNSRVITPRVKSWFAFVFRVRGYSDNPAESKLLFVKWWKLNRKRLFAGDFRHLQLLPLWPGDKAGEGVMDVPFLFSDYMAAVHSDYPSIRYSALATLLENKMATWLDSEQLQSIADILKEKDSKLHTLAYRLLAAAGNDAVPILAKVIEENGATVPPFVVVETLNTHPDSAADRARCISKIIENNDGNYLSKHKSMRVEVLPLLKQRILDAGLSEFNRGAAASHLFTLAENSDIPFLESLLAPTLPKGVRTYASYKLLYLCPPDSVPQSIRAYENDPVLGPEIKWQKAEVVKWNKSMANIAASKKAEQADEIRYRGRTHDTQIAQEFRNLMLGETTNDRSLAAQGLFLDGERGITLLKMALTMSDDDARAYAAKQLLETCEMTAEENTSCLAALVTGLGSDDSDISEYLRSREDLHAAAMPLLKERVLNSRLPDAVQNFAALHAGAWATEVDLPFFESIIGKKFPSTVRSTALHAFYRILPPEKIPDSVRALAKDKELGEVMKIYHYGGAPE